MPNKRDTERQLLSLLREAGARTRVTWLTTATYKSKNTDAKYLEKKYKTFDKVKNEKFDLFIITGAPVERMKFEEVAYWRELLQIMDAAAQNSLFRIYICWAAQAALYHFYGVKKKNLPQKCFGVFEQKIKNKNSIFYKNIPQNFKMPHSRHASFCRVTRRGLTVEAAFGREISVISNAAKNSLFITGHPEYKSDTLHKEYVRDIAAGKPIKKPKNYYPGNNPENTPQNVWRGAAVQFYKNIIKRVKELQNETF